MKRGEYLSRTLTRAKTSSYMARISAKVIIPAAARDRQKGSIGFDAARAAISEGCKEDGDSKEYRLTSEGNRGHYIRDVKIIRAVRAMG